MPYALLWWTVYVINVYIFTVIKSIISCYWWNHSPPHLTLPETQYFIYITVNPDYLIIVGYIPM